MHEYLSNLSRFSDVTFFYKLTENWEIVTVSLSQLKTNF